MKGSCPGVVVQGKMLRVESRRQMPWGDFMGAIVLVGAVV